MRQMKFDVILELLEVTEQIKNSFGTSLKTEFDPMSPQVDGTVYPQTWGPPDESTMRHEKLHETSIKMTQDIPRCGLSASHFPRGPPLGRTPMQAD
jgi:hypothetical protein